MNEQLPLPMPNVDQQLEQHAQNVERIQRDAVFEIGKELAGAQELFRYRRDEGGFTGWLDRRLPQISERTAYSAINVYQNVDPAMFAKFANIPKLGALAEIAKAEPDLQAVIAERVAAGEIFTAAAVRRLREEAVTEALAQEQKEADSIRSQLAAMRRMVLQRENDAAGLETKVEEMVAALKTREDRIAQLEKAAPPAPQPARAGLAQPSPILGDFLVVWSALEGLTDPRGPSAGALVRACPADRKDWFLALCDGARKYLEAIILEAA